LISEQLDNFGWSEFCRCGDRSRVAITRGVHKHRLLLPGWHPTGCPLWLQAEARCNGDLGGYVTWHAASDSHTGLHFLQDKMGETGELTAISSSD
jgi:hypothetical protein